MLHLLKRHPIPIQAFFRHSLVLTYALPQETLRPLLPPGLTLDTFEEFGFLAIAMVQTERLRPRFVPAAFGQNFFLTGYRIFTRFTTQAGRNLRGLRILRSDTDSRLMATLGNLFTHYRYRKAEVACQETTSQLDIRIVTPGAEADLHVRADLCTPVTAPPPGSPFSSLKEARRYAGPLPFTFDYEAQTHSIVMVQGVRKDWNPQPVAIAVLQNTFFCRPEFAGVTPILANAFHVRGIPYAWKRGVREPLPGSAP